LQRAYRPEIRADAECNAPYRTNRRDTRMVRHRLTTPSAALSCAKQELSSYL